MEVACGLAVIALSIAGLAHAFPAVLSGIAQIVFGAGLLCADGAVMTCFSRYSARRGPYGSSAQFSGLGAEAIGGLAGIVLGILTLVGLVPVVLCAVTVLVFGASVILGGAGRARVAMRAVTRMGWPEEESQVAQEAHAAALGGRALIGLAAVVLGILGIVFTAGTPVASLVLSLVGLLCLGVGALLSGSAFGGQAMTWNR